MEVLNRPAQSGRFNIRTQFPYYEETLYKPDLARRVKGKAVVFDMDMSAGDFLALIYLLKLPVEQIDLKITRFVVIFTESCRFYMLFKRELRLESYTQTRWELGYVIVSIFLSAVLKSSRFYKFLVCHLLLVFIKKKKKSEKNRSINCRCLIY